jgi:hypothetical protein
MPVTSEDLVAYYSGGASNDDPALSIGGVMSSEEIPDGVLQNLFPNVSFGEATSGIVRYRCFYLANDNDTDDVDDVTLWIEVQTPSATTAVAIGLDDAGIGDGSSTGVATEPADDVTEPDDVVFTAPANEGAGLVIGTLGAGDVIAVWVRLTVEEETAPLPSDAFTLRVSGLPV